MEEITQDYAEDIRNVVVMFKISVTKLLYQFSNGASQKSFRALSVVSTEGKDGTYSWVSVSGPHVPWRRNTFSTYYKCSKRPQSKNWMRVQAEEGVWQEERKWYT